MMCRTALLVVAFAVTLTGAPIAQAAPGSLSVTVRPAAPGAQVTLTASGPVRFTVRHLTSPERLVVDLSGLDASSLAGTQELVVPPVRAVRLAKVTGGVQVVIDLTEPVLVDLSTTADGRSLTLTLRGGGPAVPRAAPAPALPTEVLRLQHLKPRDVAAHLQSLLPGVQVRPDEATMSVIVMGTAEQIAQVKALVAALDAPPRRRPLPRSSRSRSPRPSCSVRSWRPSSRRQRSGLTAA
ncbi:MAG: secretin N-terminal domain-containing protein [Armatimonadota bacterium]|nr:secretin N-terminal domain-containing protein [Armatimonadota bacterium]